MMWSVWRRKNKNSGLKQKVPQGWARSSDKKLFSKGFFYGLWVQGLVGTNPHFTGLFNL
jgi:hypothetical protein